ncbi:hypothetical protein DSO57_1005964 [Entomophthora muscae]|uniref:Uncharacterized protein n=2 Tax=Entomophthora muscae TaxID=34485 RepID=A0ACC2TVY5_9FUNG|nr:hypothetical protein DSO57_1013641 [Entomophthora muscae]KAJ9078521.1 hypothetical protein DSO57_1005964 [Entomophthora muscae]
MARAQFFHNGILLAQTNSTLTTYPSISATPGCRIQYNFGQADFIYPQAPASFHLQVDPPPRYRHTPWINPDHPPPYNK